MNFFLLSCSFLVLFLDIPLGADPTADKPWEPGTLFLQGQTMPPFAGVMPFFHEEAGLLPAGRSNLQTSLMYFNTFRQDVEREGLDITLFLDMEGATWSGEYRYGLTRTLEISCQIQVMGAYGGFLDPFLSSFHQTFGFPNQSRDLFPENRLKWEIYKKGALILSGFPDSPVLTQTSFSLKHLLPVSFSGQDRWSLKVWGKPSLTTGSDHYMTDVWSGGLGLLYSDRWPLSTWSSGSGLVWGLSGGIAFVSTEGWNLPLRRVIYSGGFHLGLVYQSWFWGAQGSVFQSPFDVGSYYLGYRAGEVHLGFKAPLGDFWWEAALVEELLTWGAMEVGFHTGVSWKF